MVVLQPFFGGKSQFLINRGVHVSKATCRALNYTSFSQGFPKTACRIQVRLPLIIKNVGIITIQLQSTSLIIPLTAPLIEEKYICEFFPVQIGFS